MPGSTAQYEFITQDANSLPGVVKWRERTHWRPEFAFCHRPVIKVFFFNNQNHSFPSFETFFSCLTLIIIHFTIFPLLYSQHSCHAQILQKVRTKYSVLKKIANQSENTELLIQQS